MGLNRPARRNAFTLEMYRALHDGPEAAIAQLRDDAVPLFRSEDGAEGMRSFVERRAARFAGR